MLSAAGRWGWVFWSCLLLSIGLWEVGNEEGGVLYNGLTLSGMIFLSLELLFLSLRFLLSFLVKETVEFGIGSWDENVPTTGLTADTGFGFVGRVCVQFCLWLTWICVAPVIFLSGSTLDVGAIAGDGWLIFSCKPLFVSDPGMPVVLSAAVLFLLWTMKPIGSGLTIGLPKAGHTNVMAMRTGKEWKEIWGMK